MTMLNRTEHDDVWALIDKYTDARETLGYVKARAEMGIVPVDDYNTWRQQCEYIKAEVEHTLMTMTNSEWPNDNMTLILTTNERLTASEAMLIKRIINGRHVSTTVKDGNVDQ